jgi:hypothetical protein
MLYMQHKNNCSFKFDLQIKIQKNINLDVNSVKHYSAKSSDFFDISEYDFCILISPYLMARSYTSLPQQNASFLVGKFG